MHAAVPCPGHCTLMQLRGPDLAAAQENLFDALFRCARGMALPCGGRGGQRQRQNKRKLDKETGKGVRRRAAHEDADGLAGVLVGDARNDPLPVWPPKLGDHLR